METYIHRQYLPIANLIIKLQAIPNEIFVNFKAIICIHYDTKTKK